MDKLSFKEKLLLVVMLCVLIVVAAYMGGMKPLNKKVDTAQAAYNKVESDKKAKDDVIDGRVMREQGIGLLIGEIEDIETTYAIGTTHENMDIVFTNLSSAHNLTTNSFSVNTITENAEEHNKKESEKVKVQGEIKKVIETSTVVNGDATQEAQETIVTAENGLTVENFQYSLSGSYKGMLDFIEDLNKEDKVQINSFSITFNDSDELENRLAINIYLKELGEDYTYARDSIPKTYQFLSDKVKDKDASEDTKK